MTTITAPASSLPSDHADLSAGRGWLKRVPLLTGVLAALAGFLTVRGANLSNQAIYHSNQGVLHQARASDAWAEYQANSIKARIVETTLLTAIDTASKDALNTQAKELRVRQPTIRATAEDQEQQRDAELTGGQRRLAEKDLLDYAGMAAQLGIALASVAALTRRRDAFAVGVVCGALGVAITAYAIVVNHFVHA
ncbi:MAG TPA: DUF4337 family protein [Tepidisphaeraceae bacterium]|nr:DUF4337 family protein [Tepidisphaeraceae bacterium]